MTRKILVRPGLCDGCGECITACGRAASLRQGQDAPVIKILKDAAVNVPELCRSCSDAPCVRACMAGCRYQNGEGWVVTDYSRCVGCWMCIMACPFGAIERVGDEHVAVKCDGCLGSDIAPCVAACPAGALSHQDILQYAAALRRETAERFLAGVIVQR